MSKLIIIATLIMATCISCSYMNRILGLKDDNIAEEMIEEAIDHYTGIDVDLTPESKE